MFITLRDLREKFSFQEGFCKQLVLCVKLAEISRVRLFADGYAGQNNPSESCKTCDVNKLLRLHFGENGTELPILTFYKSTIFNKRSEEDASHEILAESEDDLEGGEWKMKRGCRLMLLSCFF